MRSADHVASCAKKRKSSSLTAALRILAYSPTWPTMTAGKTPASENKSAARGLVPIDGLLRVSFRHTTPSPIRCQNASSCYTLFHYGQHRYQTVEIRSEERRVGKE